jgi:hypothetical protein
MSLPRKEIAIALLKQYPEMRQKNRPPVGMFDTVVDTGNRFAKFVSGQASDKSTLEVIDTLVRRFEDLDSFVKCTNLIQELAERAYEAQRQKFGTLKDWKLTEKESLFCEFLHAIRNYIVLNISQEGSPYQREYAQLLSSMVAERIQLQNKIDTDRYNYHTDVSKLVAKRDELILQLAYLEEPQSIGLAIDHKLLTNLAHLNNLPDNMVSCLQKNYCHIFYKKTIQPKTLVSFVEFSNRAIEDYNAQQSNGMEVPPAVINQAASAQGSAPAQNHELQLVDTSDVDEPVLLNVAKPGI